MNAAKIGIAAVLICLCALVAPIAFAEPLQVPEASEEYKTGTALQDEEKFEEAREHFESGAEKGDAWCTFALSLFYGNGWGGLEKDDARAAKLITNAAGSNVPPAHTALGNAYMFGASGMPKNVEKALAHWEIAADLDDPEATMLLASVNLWGENGVPMDTEKGLAYLTKAADLNHPDALYTLGNALLEGDHGLEPNPEKGLELIRRAADLGHPEAAEQLESLSAKDEPDDPKDDEKPDGTAGEGE